MERLNGIMIDGRGEAVEGRRDIFRVSLYHISEHVIHVPSSRIVITFN